MSEKSAAPPIGLNAEAATLKKRWTEQLKKAGVSDADNAAASPGLMKRMTLSGNAWADCAEVEELHSACVNGTTGLKPDGALCQAALRYFELCQERDEFCQDPTEH
jgi:hypothetical protein